jgi:DNA-binding response OmpR family regulator
MLVNAEAQSKVIFVDDEPDLRDWFAEELSATFHVKTYGSAREALATIDQSNAPDLIITDVKMPEIDGFQFVETLRLQNILTPVIMISGHCDQYDVAESLKLGISRFMFKPFDIQHLIAESGNLVVQYRLRAIEMELLRFHSLLQEDTTNLLRVYFDRLTELQNYINTLSNVPENVGRGNLKRLTEVIRHEKSISHSKTQLQVLNEMRNELIEASIKANLEAPSFSQKRTA